MFGWLKFPALLLTLEGYRFFRQSVTILLVGKPLSTALFFTMVLINFPQFETILDLALLGVKGLIIIVVPLDISRHGDDC